MNKKPTYEELESKIYLLESKIHELERSAPLEKFNIDNTVQKEIEQALKESEEKFRIIFENSLTAMLVADDRGKYLYVNNAATKLFGYSMEEFLVMHVGDLITTNDTNAATRYEAYLRKGQEVGEFEFVTRDGEKKISQYQAIRIKPDFNFSINMDITHQKIIEQDLKLYVNQLNELNADKDRFISILAHDLKSPFNSILGYLSLLTTNVRVYDLDKIERQITLINNSAHHLHSLLDDLLNWAVAKSSKQRIDIQKLFLPDICDEIVESFRLQAESKGIAIGHTVQKDDAVFADMDMVKTILRNLISNALKFTKAGGHVSVRFDHTGFGTSISVVDTGVGISAEKRKQLFNAAILSSAKGTSGEVGTGFGLLLCKELVEKQGGCIEVESEPGRGSTFKFTFPVVNNTA